MKYFFLDWCPKPASALLSGASVRGSCLAIDVDSFEIVNSVHSENIAEVFFASRHDGIFLFLINVEIDLDLLSVRALSRRVSYLIKEAEKHIHNSNRGDYGVLSASLARFSVGPIELECKMFEGLKLQQAIFDKIEDILFSEEDLLTITAKYGSWDTQNSPEQTTMPAVIRLRGQYLRIFERYMKYKSAVRSADFFSIQEEKFQKRAYSVVEVAVLYFCEFFRSRVGGIFKVYI